MAAGGNGFGSAEVGPSGEGGGVSCVSRIIKAATGGAARFLICKGAPTGARALQVLCTPGALAAAGAASSRATVRPPAGVKEATIGPAFLSG